MTVIERNVAVLDFDGKGFKKGIDGSLSDLNRLRDGMDLENSTKHVGILSRAFNSLNVNPLASGIGNITARLSTMGVIGATIINRLTNSVIDGTQRMFNTLITLPMRQGLAEYETQMNSIQTILANTRSKGTVLEDVENALAELNRYADLTIYNFTNMTDSIGKFTAAGVDLDVSVAAIKGIANLAAVSGSNSQQASNAMYQLSQAIATGSLKLQDWNSVVNAGLGGEVFQEALKETARVHGVAVDTIIERNGSFRASLQEGWITTDILLDTLAKFTGDLTEEQLRSIGYTEEQIAEIIKLGETANDAATKIKTLSQLKDTVAEAMQSGWSQTWSIIFGDFDEAKELFGSIGDYLGNMVGESANARNDFFQQWKDFGGRDAAISIVTNSFIILSNTISNFKSATRDVFEPFTAFDLTLLTFHISAFIDRLKETTETGTRFKSIVRGVASVLNIIRMAITAVLSPLFSMKDGIFAGTNGFIDMLAIAGDWLFNLQQMISETDFFGRLIRNLQTWLKNARSSLEEWFDQFLQLEPIQDLIKILSLLGTADPATIFDALMTVLSGAGKVVGGLVLGFISLVDSVSSLTPIRTFLDYIKNTFTYDNLRSFINDMVDYLPVIEEKVGVVVATLKDLASRASDTIQSFKGAEAFKSFVAYIDSMDGSRFKAFLSDLKSDFDFLVPIVNSVKDGMGAFIENVIDALPSLDEFKTMAGDAIKSVFDYLNNPDGSIDFIGLSEVIALGLLAALTKAVHSISTGGFLSDLWEKVFGADSSLSTSITGALDALSSTLTTWQTSIKAETIQKIAIAIGVVAASALALSLVDSEKLLASIGALTVLIAELFGGAAVLSKANFTGLTQSVVAILALAGSLLALSVAVKIFSTLSPEELGTGMVGIGLGITGFIASFKALSIGPLKTGMIKLAIAFGILSAGLIVLAVAVEKMGSLPLEVVEDGLIRIGIALAGFVVFTKLSSGADMIATAAGIGIMGAAIIVLAAGITAMGAIPWDILARGLVGLAAALLIIGVAVTLMSGALAGAAAILVVSAAIFVLANAMTILGQLSWEEIGMALVAMAGVFLVFGIAGYLLAPVVPVLLGLGTAMLLIGLAALAVGAGTTLAAGGLVLLAGASVGIAGAIYVIGAALADVLPVVATAFGEAIANFFVTIAERSPELFEAAKTMIRGLLQAIVEVTPEIVLGLIDLLITLLQGIAERLPDFIQAGFDILLGFLQGIADNIQEVVETGADIVIAFIDGMTEKIPELVEAGYAFLIAFVTAIVEEFDRQGQPLFDKAFDSAANLINGLKDGIRAGVQSIIDAAWEVGQAAIDAFNNAFDNHSPSKIAFGIGKYVSGGLGLGILAGAISVIDAVKQVSSKAQNGMKDLAERANIILSEGIDLSPVITPVIDTSGAMRSMATLDSGLRGTYRRTASLSYSIDNQKSNAGNITEISSDTSSDGGSGVTYIQNNYSPKALNSQEIYRQTNSQLQELKERGKTK